MASRPNCSPNPIISADIGHVGGEVYGQPGRYFAGCNGPGSELLDPFRKIVCFRFAPVAVLAGRARLVSCDPPITGAICFYSAKLVVSTAPKDADSSTPIFVGPDNSALDTNLGRLVYPMIL